MARPWTATELAAAIALGGSVAAVAIPSFLRNLSFSKLSEPIEALDRMVTGALVYAEGKPQPISFPPAAPLTPAEVPRGVAADDPPDAWEHLTWKSLRFHFDHPHRFSFQFDSALDPQSGVMRFTATARGDLDGDGVLSLFEVRGQRVPGQAPQALPGMFVDGELE